MNQIKFSTLSMLASSFFAISCSTHTTNTYIPTVKTSDSISSTLSTEQLHNDAAHTPQLSTAKSKSKSKASNSINEAQIKTAKRAAEETAYKKAEAKRIASSRNRDFEKKVKRAWNPPASVLGQKASARVTLSDSGAVLSVVVNASDPDMKANIEAAVRAAAPYPMPSDPDARREARVFTTSFTAQ